MSAGSLTHWCHECETSVQPRGRRNPLCPSCRGSFLEEIDHNTTQGHGERWQGPVEVVVTDNAPWDMSDLSRQSRHTTVRSGFDTGFSPLFDALTAMMQEMDDLQPPRSSIRTRRRHPNPPDSSDPLNLLHREIQQLFGHGPMDPFHDTGVRSAELPGHLGDYFFGPNLDQLMQQLAENDPNRYGTPPALQSAVDAMPSVRINREHLRSESRECAVCKEQFTVGTTVREMPCKHLYHSACILPWLALHNSCPVCRYEMPSDPNWSPVQAASSAQAQAPSRRTRERGDGASRGNVRRMPFNLPWPFCL